MNQFRNIISYLPNPFILALIPTVLTILFLPDIYTKYEVKQISKKKVSVQGSTGYYVDLNNNGSKERIEAYQPEGKHNLSFQVFGHDGGIFGQFDFDRDFYSKRLFFGDIDNNDYKEVYGISLSHDSVFINWIEPFTESNFNRHSRFITRIENYPKIPLHFSLAEIHFVDLNNDGYDELVFPINAESSLQPRAVYVFDIKNRKVNSSISFGSSICDLIFKDLNKDGNTEIISGKSGAAKNIPDHLDVPFKDDRPWLKVFTSELDTFFKPISFPKGMATAIYCQVLSDDQNPKINVLYYNWSYQGANSFISTFDISGNLLKRIYLPELGHSSEPKFIEFNDNYMVFLDLNHVLIYSKEFELKEQKYLSQGGYFHSIIDIDENGKNEIFMLTEDNSIMIYDQNLNNSNYIILDHPLLITHIDNIKVEKNKFFLRTQTDTYIYSYRYNYLYILKYPIYTFIYLFVILIIYGLRKIQEAQVREKFRLKEQVRELQFMSFKNKLDPHFMFNAFSAVASMIKSGNSENAYNSFLKVTKLIRKNLIHADQLYISLEEELDVVRNYIDLQKIRFEDKFSYDINVDSKIDLTLNIPQMIIQIHVENSVKHGLLTKEEEGRILINVNIDNGNLIINIEDNGIGRKKASKIINNSTGLGIKTMKGFIKAINKNNKNKITQKIVDLKSDTSKAIGTKVIITIPINFKYPYLSR